MNTNAAAFRQKRNRCCQFFVKFDIEGQAFRFKLPDGKDKYQTCIGGVCYIFVSIILLLYSVSTLIELVTRQNYTLVTKEFEGVNVYSSFTFGKDNGFAVAAGISGSDNNWDAGEEDLEIGQLKFVIKHWNDVTESTQFRELKSRKCTEEDFKIEEGQARSSYGFYKQDEAAQNTIASTLSSLKCIDDSYEIKGPL